MLAPRVAGAAPLPVPPAPPPCATPARCALFGVNVELRQYPPAELDAVLERLAQVGITAVRQPVSWADVEPRQGELAWRQLDELVAAAGRHGLRLLLTLSGAPAWSRHDPAPPAGLWLCDDAEITPPKAARFAPPTDPADLAAFAGRLAARYGQRLWAVEVWPESNLMPNWRATGPDPEEYARLLGPVAAAVRAASPGTMVISGGLAPTTDVGVCALSDVVFLDRLARTGVLGQVDGIGIEPYGLRSGPAEGSADREQLNFRRAEVLAGVLTRHHMAAPLWAVAWGWSAQPTAGPVAPSPWGWHPAATAARWTAEGYALARGRWPWLGPMFLMHLQPAESADKPAWGFALLDHSGHPLPAWAAAADVAAGRLPALPADPPWRPTPRQVSLALLALLALVTLALRPWLAPPMARLLAPVAAVPLPWLAAVYGLAVGLDIVGPPRTSLLAVPIMAIVTTVAPAVAIGATVFALPFYYGLDMWVGPQAFDGVEFLLLAAVGGRLAAWYLGTGVGPAALPRRNWRAAVRPLSAAVAARLRRLHWADWLVAAVVVWAGLSLAWSEFREPALRQWRTVLLEPAVLYALLRAAPDRRRAAQWALDGLVAGGALAAAWGVLAAVLYARGLGGTGVMAEGVVRATGPYASPNNLALMLGRLVPVIATYALWSSGRRRTLFRLAAVPVLLGLVATFSRGALLVGLPATALYLALVALHRFDRRRLLWVAAGLTGLAALVAPFARTERLAGAFRLGPGGTGFIRFRLWQSAVAMGRDHPWGGVGLDNFLYLYRDRYVQRDAVQERFLNHPHNWLLDWWTRLGLVGLGLWLAVVAANAQAGLRGLRRDGDVRLLAVAALGMQLYALAHGLVDNHFFLVDLAAVWWIAQAALLAAEEA
jgi:O-antigen ligase